MVCEDDQSGKTDPGASNSRGWEHFHHMADIGIRAYGETLASAFEQAGTALTAVITDPATVASSEAITVSCEAPDEELLFVDWLNALIYEMATRSLLFSRFDVRITGTKLHATAWGEGVDRERHQPAVEPKGATFTELRVFRNPQGLWVGQCVIDV